jgi:hypothetical protein
MQSVCSCRLRLVHFQQSDQFFHGPNMIGHPSFHSGCDPQGLVNTAEIVTGMVARNHVAVILVVGYFENLTKAKMAMTANPLPTKKHNSLPQLAIRQTAS